MKKYSLLLIIVLLNNYAFSQITTSAPQVTKPLPTIGSMMDYADIPVNTYTGVPDINIPLYSLPTYSKDFNVNLSLNYHPAGVSFFNKASDLGTGWNLTADFAISRTIVNEPDDFYGAANSYKNEFNDVYTYNFFGHTGRFRIVRDISNDTFTLRKMDNSVLDIQFDMNPATFRINSFTIYDDQGYKYVFDQRDNAVGKFWTHVEYLPYPLNQTMGYLSTHHLKHVFDNNGNEIINYGYTLYESSYFPATTLNNKALKLTTITATGFGKAEINYDYNSSLDYSLSDPVQMTDIQVKDVHNHLIKKIGFTSSYTEFFEKDRRFLETVTEYDNTLAEVKKYELDYNTDVSLVLDTLLPCEDYELGKDMYGYATLMPKYHINNGPSYFQGAINSTLPDVCTIGALTSMKLPTGGTIKYEFESNTIPASTNPADYLNGYPDPALPNDNYSQAVYDSTSFTTSSTTTWQFTVTGTTPKTLFIKGVGTEYTSPLSDPPSAPLLPQFNVTGNGITPLDLENADLLIHPCIGKILTLAPGTYTVTANKLPGTATTCDITITEFVTNTPIKGWTYHAGLRIKKISHYDSGAANPAKEANYDYQRFDNPNVSSGYMYYGDMASDVNDLYDEFYNNMVGYSNVKVWNTGTSGNGYTKYFYRNYNEELAQYTPPGGSTSFTYAPDILCYKKGLLAKIEVYNDNGDILTSTENDYDFEEEGDVISPTTNLNLFTRYSWANLSERISKSYFYDISGTHTLETKEYFTYNSLNQRVDEHKVENSIGGITKTKNYYHTGNSSLSQNRISELEKVETYRDTELLTTSQINYLNTFSGNVSYLPETVTTAKGSNTPETRLRYTDYDEFSNPLQVQQENGMVTSYIWGYHKTVPVAKIENLDYASIPSATITAIQNKSDSATGHGELRVLLNNLRTSFPDAMVTTMTYNPLIGLRTLTDPKGDSIKYEYDNFNRLKAVRDKDNHILTENEYHYKNITTSQNYIKTKAYKIESSDFMSNPSVTQAVQGITYYDGLGRTIQKIANRQSGDGKDIITHISYDALGRQAKEFLPFPSSQTNMTYFEGTTLVEAISAQYLTQYGDHHPYSEKVYEASPLNRVLEQAAPGDEWSLTNATKHTIRFDYQTNGHNEVKLFTATSDFINNTITLNNGSGSVFYDDTELYKTITKNENWKAGDGTDNTTEEFKDKEGRTVLSRKYNGSDVYNTYNVYDQYGNLAFVIPPVADSSIGNTELSELCYQYKYDYRNRLIEKKLPGKQWEYIAYNSQDKPVATGPALNPFTGKDDGWLITKYDIFGRVVCTGWLDFDVDGSNRLYIESQVDGSSWYEQFSLSPVTVDNVAMSYTDNIYPTDFKILTVNYYDGYDFTGAPSTIPSTVETQPVLENVKGLPTGSWVRVLTKDNETFADESYILYDKKARPIRNYTKNYLGGFTQVDSRLTFTGRIEYTKTSHKRTSIVFDILDTYYYTNQDRLSKHTQKINSGLTETINENVYDNLGQLIRKDVGGTGTAYQKVDYTYNIRGWLLGINDVANLNVGAPASDPIDLFAFGINYNKSINNDDGGVIVPQYNGNIAETNWRSATDDILRRYGYTYDKLNRLTKAVYQKPNNTVPVTQMYNERIDYDKNGNITLLKRNGDFDSDYYSPIEIDFLEYHYKNDNPNLLLKVTDSSNSPKGFSDDTVTDLTDSSDDYDYDLYGNLISDENKGIESISYNHLNLPIKISFATGDKIEYLYDALGEKVRKTVNKVPSEIVTDYLDGFQYVNGNLDFIGQPEGYVKATYCDICPTGIYSLNYVYQYKDHLGNIRLSYGYDQKADKVKIIGEDHYYPYGLKHTRYNTGEKIYSPDEEQAGKMALIEVPSGGLGMNNYKYNGKEWQDELGLNMYAMDMRQYDPAIARWVVQDPIVHHSQSPYNGYDGNPVFFADPSGGRTMASDYNWSTGEYRSGSWQNAVANVGGELYQPNLHSEMDTDIGVNADGNVFNEISVHVIGDPPLGSNGKPNGPAIALDTVVLYNHCQYYFQGYFDGPDSGDYGPYTPDGVGMTFSISGDYNFTTYHASFSLVSNSKTEVGGFYTFGTGLSTSFSPTGNLGISMDNYDTYGGSNLFEGLTQYSKGGAVSFNNFSISHSQSAIMADNKQLIFSSSGVVSNSIFLNLVPGNNISAGFTYTHRAF